MFHSKHALWVIAAALLLLSIAVFAAPGGVKGKPDRTAPTAPTNLTATAGANSIQLSWNASTDNVGVSGYEVFRSATSGGTYSLLATVSATGYLDSAVSPGQTRFYKVRAFDAAGNRSGFSNVASATANVPPTVVVPDSNNNVADANGFAAVSVTANASDSDGTVASMAWSGGGSCSFLGQTDSGIGTSSASSTAHYRCPIGSFFVTATATDNRGAIRSDSGTITVV